MDKKFLILAVDDEEDIRESVKNVLEDEGFRVVSAKDGKDCLNKLEKNKPDLILLDILMPGLTTKELVKEIRKKTKTPIIFLTVVKLSESTKQDIIKGNMLDYIEKPFDNEELVTRVKRALKISKD
jgi:DNA-binding response OmpR family regulator